MEPTESPPETTASGRHPLFRQHLYEELMLLVLLGLALAGIAWTDISPLGSRWYWYLMVPVYFVASLLTEMPHVRHGRYPWRSVLWYQLWQWLAVLAAVWLVFLIQQVGRLNNETTGLILLLLFALSTFVAGLRMGWLFRLAGLFLAASLLMVVYLERYLWLIVLLGLLLMALHHAIHRFQRRRSRHAATP